MDLKFPIYEDRAPSFNLMKDVWNEPAGFQCVAHRNDHLRKNLERTFVRLPAHLLPPVAHGVAEVFWVLDATPYHFRGHRADEKEANSREFDRRLNRAKKFIEDNGAEPLVASKQADLRNGHFTKGVGFRAKFSRTKVLQCLHWYVDEKGSWYKAIETYSYWGGEVGGSSLDTQSFEPIATPSSALLKDAALTEIERARGSLLSWSKGRPLI